MRNFFKIIQSVCPSNGAIIAQVQEGTVSDYKSCVEASTTAWNTWVDLPAPKRGEIVRQIGDALRKKIVPLGQLVSLEMGKLQRILPFLVNHIFPHLF